MLSAFQPHNHHQFNDPPRDFKLCHMQQQQQQNQQLSQLSPNDCFLQTDPDSNNNLNHALTPPLTPPTPTGAVSGFLGLPYHCYNYQDFPVYFNNTGGVVPRVSAHQGGNTKAWRAKRVIARKRKLPEKVLRERQLRRNERERARQNRLNDAFDVLRNTIPEFLTPCKTGQKLTQIETLKLAKHYIASMRELLTDNGVPESPFDVVMKTLGVDDDNMDM